MGNAIMLKDLIAAGAPLNERDSQGRTALTLARSAKHAEAAKVLEAAGATE
jgi:ankyrin repeat protein